jgi:hypothetical protein
MKRNKQIILAVLVLCMSAISAKGDYIPLIEEGTGTDSGWAISFRSDIEGGNVSAVHVYDVIDDAVLIGIEKVFDKPFGAGFSHPIIIEFIKTSPDGTSSIIIDQENNTNETGTPWYSYDMHLMVGMTHPQAGFVPEHPPDGDQFENVYYSMNYGYDDLPVHLSFTNSAGAGVGTTSGLDNLFQPGAVDGRITIVTDPAMEAGDCFGLKEVPEVPEPATILLLGFGSLLLGHRRRA